MKQLQFIIFCFLAFCAASLMPTAAAPEKGKIVSFIEKHRTDREILFNTPKYDKNAKVFYLYHPPHTSYKEVFEEYTGFLAPVHKKIYFSGAEILLLIVHSESDTEMYKMNKRGDRVINMPKECRKLTLRCPIINVHRDYERAPFIKPLYSSRKYSTLRAVDADANPLAIYYCVNDEIIAMDANGKNPRKLMNVSGNSKEWVKDAIYATYKSLVSQVKGETDTSTSEPEEEKPEKKAPRKQKRPREDAPTRWRKI